MKKLVALLLAALMALGSVAAFAEPAESPAIVTTVSIDGIIADNAADGVAALAAKLAELGVYGFVAPETADALKAIFGEAEVEVNEVFAFTRFDASGDLKLDFTFPTPYRADKKVAMVVLLPNAETVFEGAANDAGAVTVNFDAATVDAIHANIPVFAFVVNEK